MSERKQKSLMDLYYKRRGEILASDEDVTQEHRNVFDLGAATMAEAVAEVLASDDHIAIKASFVQVDCEAFVKEMIARIAATSN